MRRVLTPDQRAAVQCRCGSALIDEERFDEARSALESSYPSYVESRGRLHSNTRDAAAELARRFERWGAAAPGKGHAARAGEWRRKAGPGL